MVGFAVNASSTYNTTQGILVLGHGSECQVARVQRGVCRIGSRVRVEESRALILAHSLRLPVPAFHEVNASSDQAETLMDFVHGECLEEAWLSMTRGRNEASLNKSGTLYNHATSVV